MTIVSAISDLHLEFMDATLPGGDILLVCGDTLLWDMFRLERTDREALRYRPIFERFLAEELRKYWKALIVLGNHDFFGGYLESTPQLARETLAKYAPNAVLLHNEFTEIDGTRFIGTPLWATYGYGTANHYLLQKGMKDFTRISRHGDRLLVRDIFVEHTNAVTFMKQALQTDKPCVVMTHHAPTYLAINRQRFPDGKWDDAYASNQHELIMDTPNVRMWFHGHIHDRYRTQIGEARLAANPRGYSGHELMAGDFDPLACDFDLATLEFMS
jgi:Icc-related predicted phosphoesterase